MENYRSLFNVGKKVISPTQHWWVFASKYRHIHNTRAIKVLREWKIPRNYRQLASFSDWELVADSAQSKEQALELARSGGYIGEDGEEIFGNDKPCTVCGAYLHVSLVRAKQWTDTDTPTQHGRIISFYGNLCGPCISSGNFSELRNVSSIRG